MSNPVLTRQTMKVLGALRAGVELSGADVAAETGLFTGTLYPILFRLEKAGWVSSRWESAHPETLKRPRRRFYRIEAAGLRTISEIEADLHLTIRPRLATC